MTLKMPLRTYYSLKNHNSSSFNKKSVKCNKTETKKVAILSEKKSTKNLQNICDYFWNLKVWKFESLKLKFETEMNYKNYNGLYLGTFDDCMTMPVILEES